MEEKEALMVILMVFSFFLGVLFVMSIFLAVKLKEIGKRMRHLANRLKEVQ